MLPVTAAHGGRVRAGRVSGNTAHLAGAPWGGEFCGGTGHQPGYRNGGRERSVPCPGRGMVNRVLAAPHRRPFPPLAVEQQPSRRNRERRGSDERDPSVPVPDRSPPLDDRDRPRNPGAVPDVRTLRKGTGHRRLGRSPLPHLTATPQPAPTRAPGPQRPATYSQREAFTGLAWSGACQALSA